MKFEEILQPLRDGKKVRRKSWKNKEFYMSKYTTNIENFIATDWEIYEEPILDEVERRYLRNVIRPFRDRVINIKKLVYPTNVSACINIRIQGEVFKESFADMDLPLFKANTMYKGMKANKEYTLKELGL